jgi:hypothetical protein
VIRVTTSDSGMAAPAECIGQQGRSFLKVRPTTRCPIAGT